MEKDGILPTVAKGEAMNRLEVISEQRMRGSMLIVAMGILALLSVMAIAFTRLVKLESVSSTNYLDMIRAEQLAKSGQERAKVGLQVSQRTSHMIT